MGSSSFEKYLDILDEAGLSYYIPVQGETKNRYIASEDIEDGQVIIAKFDIDDNLLNIMADLTVNSLDEFINRCENI